MAKKKVVDPDTGEVIEVEVADAGDEDGDEKKVEDPAAVAASMGKAFADTFKKELEEQRRSSTPPAPTRDVAAEQKKLVDDTTAMWTKYREMCEAGEYDKAAQMLVQFSNDTARRTAGDVTQDPSYKAIYATTKRVARSENKDIFDKYGTEVDAEIGAMQPAERLNPDMWDEAVRRVKARHIDEILSERVEAGIKEREAASRPGGIPQAPGSRGRSTPSVEPDLDEDMQAVGEWLGFTPEEYKKAAKTNEERRIKRGFSRGLVEVMPPGNPAPGSF